MKFRPRKPPRYNQDNSIYFLTFCTFRRIPLLHVPGIPEFLIEELHYYEKKIENLIAYTIMRDHVHLLLSVNAVQDLSIFLRDFKKYTSIEITKRLKISRQSNQTDQILMDDCKDSGIHQKCQSRDQSLNINRVWQPGTMDHCIRMGWEGNDYDKHLSYLFYNSFKHLGCPPINFPYHNFTDFVRLGVFGRDFCAIDESTVHSSHIYEP